MDKKSVILITGANGMLGKILVEELNKKNFKSLILVDRFNLDLTKRDETITFFKKNSPEYVFHVAAKVGGIKNNLENPVEFLRENLLINTNVIDASFFCGVKKILNISSAAIYPNKTDILSEEDLLSGPLEKENEAYSLSKIAGIKLCEYYNKEYKTNFISLISPNLFGEYSKFDANNSNVVAALIKKFHEAKEEHSKNVSVWGTGNVKREFLYVRDLANLLITAMMNLNQEDTYEGRLNCGLKQEISIRELSEKIKEVVGFRGDILFDKTKPEGRERRLLNSDRLISKIKNVKMTDLTEGLSITYNFFLEDLSRGNHLDK